MDVFPAWLIGVPMEALLSWGKGLEQLAVKVNLSSAHSLVPCCSDSTKHTAMGVGRLDPVVLRSLVLVVRVVWVVLAAEDKKLPADGRSTTARTNPGNLSLDDLLSRQHLAVTLVNESQQAQ